MKMISEPWEIGRGNVIVSMNGITPVVADMRN